MRIDQGRCSVPAQVGVDQGRGSSTTAINKPNDNGNTQNADGDAAGRTDDEESQDRQLAADGARTGSG